MAKTEHKYIYIYISCYKMTHIVYEKVCAKLPGTVYYYTDICLHPSWIQRQLP